MSMREQIRELFQKGLSNKQIVAKLGVTKSLVSYHCSDIIPRYGLSSSDLVRPSSAIRKTTKTDRPRLLGDEDAIAIRKLAKVQDPVDYAALMEKHKVKKEVLFRIINGLNYRHLNHIEAPVGHAVDKPSRSKETRAHKAALVVQAARMMREDPHKWTYRVLALWFSEQTGRRYLVPSVVHLLHKHDPSLKEIGILEKRVYTKRVRTPAATDKRRDDAAALRKLIAEENRYEKWVRDGCPGEFV